MQKEDYRRISIENFAKQVQVNVITEKDGLIISQGNTTIKEYDFEFEYPYILEGIIFILCTGGASKIKINLSEYDLSKNRVLVASPNHIIQLLEKSDDLQIDFLFFTFDFISGIRVATELGNVAKVVGQQPCLEPDAETFAELLTIHSLMAGQYKKNDLYRDDIVRNLLYSFMFIILKIYSEIDTDNPEKKMSRQENIYTKFISLLFQHYKTERSLKFYADKLHLTPKYFSEVIKKSNGLSATEWIDEMVIMGAKAMLKSSGLTVAQISEELNFANPSFFGTYFKKRVGVTPLQYREG